MYGSSQGGSAHLRLRRDVGLRADVAADGQVVAEFHQAGLQLQRTADTGVFGLLILARVSDISDGPSLKTSPGKQQLPLQYKASP